MKSFFLILMVFFLLQSVSAVSINLNKENYQPGETLLGTLEGNFINTINFRDVSFYSETQEIPMIYDLVKINEKYYFYALLPEEIGNYTIKIKEVSYIRGSKEIKEDLEKNFTISGSLIDFSVSPGFILTKNDFSVNAINNKEQLSLASEFNNNQATHTIRAGDTKKLYFSVSGINNFTLTELKLSSPSASYLVPVIVVPESASVIPTQRIRFEKSSFSFIAYINTKEIKKINLINLGQENFTDIILSYPKKFEEAITISPDKFNLESGESQEINLTIFSLQEGSWDGELTASSGNASDKISIAVEVTKNITNVNSSIIPALKTCIELSGKICTYEEICNGTFDYGSDGKCCLGSCYTPSVTSSNKSSSTLKYVAIAIIIILLLGILFFVYKKYKSKPKTEKEIFKEKETNFEERFKPTEIRGNLTRT